MGPSQQEEKLSGLPVQSLHTGTRDVSTVVKIAQLTWYAHILNGHALLRRSFEPNSDKDIRNAGAGRYLQCALRLLLHSTYKKTEAREDAWFP